VFESKDWELALDLEIDNAEHNIYASGLFYLYFLKEQDKTITEKMYAMGATNNADGLSIKINQNRRNVPEDPKNLNSRTVRGHSIEARVVEGGKKTSKQNECKTSPFDYSSLCHQLLKSNNQDIC